MFKRSIVFMAVAILTVSAAVAQMTVEESYLQDAIENMIIRETSRSGTRDQKLIALDYINDAINRGNTSSDVREALEYLSGEGRRIVAREDGRIVNNFPDVRRRSAMYLGKIGTEEASRALNEIIQHENEPMVLQEVIKSLGDIAINNDNETVNNIVWIVRRFDNLNPDNLLALATIDAFENIARKNGGLTSTDAIQLLIRISEGNYVRPVQERARQLLANLRNIR